MLVYLYTNQSFIRASVIRLDLYNECTNLASLSFSLFKIIISVFWFTSELLSSQLFNFLFLNFHYPTFWISRKNYFVLLKRKLYRKILSFLRGRIKSSQKRGKHVLAAMLPILQLVVVLWKMKDGRLVCNDLYLGFLVLFYFA